jgi:hypothetical protein
VCGAVEQKKEEMSPFFYQLKRELSLSKKDPAAMAADAPLQQLFKNSGNEQVVCCCDKREQREQPNQRELLLKKAKKISLEAYLYI